VLIYFFFFILSFLPLVEGELLGLSNFLLLVFCLPLTIYLQKKKKWNTRLLSFFTFFLVSAFLAAFFSPVWARSFNKLIVYCAFFIWFSASVFLSKKKVFKKLLIISILFPSIVLTLLSFYFLIIGQAPPFASMNLVFANFGHNHLVDFLIFSFPVSLVLYVQQEKGAIKNFYLLLSIIFSIGFLMSFSRGGVLIAFLELLILTYSLDLFKKKPNSKTVFIKLFLILFLTISIIYGSGLSSFLYQGKVDNKVLKKFLRPASFSSRLEYWRQAVSAFSKKPFSGWGLDNFRYLSLQTQKNPNSWSWYAHNHFLQMFSETGILGGVFFLILIGLIFKKSVVSLLQYRSTNSKKLIRTGLATALLGSIVHNFFDFDWQFNSVFLIFWVVAGFIYSSQTKKSLQKKLLINYFSFFLGLFVVMVAFLQGFSSIVFLKAVASEPFQKEELIKKSFKFWPFDLKRRKVLIDFYQKRNEFGKAEEQIKKLINLEPVFYKNYLLQAEIYLQQNKNLEAIESLQKTIKFNPKIQHPYFQLIKLYQKESYVPTSLFEVLEKLEKIKGERCKLKCLGFENEDRIKNILIHLIKSEQFSQLNKRQKAQVYYWLAILTTYQYDWGKGIGFLSQAVFLDPQQEYQSLLEDLHLAELVQKAFSAGNYQKVISLTKDYQSKEKEHGFWEKFYLSEGYFYLGKIYFEKGEESKADDYWEKGLQINPWDERIIRIKE